MSWNGLVEREDGSRRKMVRLALRWLLLLATAVLLFPPGAPPASAALTTALLAAVAVSNLVLTLMPERTLRSHRLDYVLVISDTFLVALALFQTTLIQAHLPLVFFVTLLLSVLGADLPRTLAGTTLVAALYVYLSWKGWSVGGVEMTAIFLRIPFLYVTSLYYGTLVHQARRDQEHTRRLEREGRDMRIFLDVTTAATSTLDVHEVLYVIVRRVAVLVRALRCSIITVDERSGDCRVMASSDNPSVNGLPLDLTKYPEVRKAIETHQPVVIQDVAREPLMAGMQEQLRSLGYESILVVPLLHQHSLIGMLVLRAARAQERFTPDELAACQIVANASANALRNAMLFEQVRSEAQSRKRTTDQLQSILDHFPDLIYTTDLEGRLTEFSRGGEALLGLRREKVLGRPHAELYTEPRVLEQLAAPMSEGVPIRDLQTTLRRTDGSSREVLVTAAPLRDEQGRPNGCVAIISDISDLKAAQRNLAQAEKLSAMGGVVSGVAHELNNPLAGVLGFAQLLMGSRLDARLQRFSERIYESALRCQKIVENLLAFARRHPTEKRSAGLNDLVEKALEIKEYQLRVNNIKVVRRLGGALPDTMLDPHQIQQVLLNVFNNAQHALTRDSGQGTLVVSTALRRDMLELVIEDDGPGIPTAILGKVFDPFFTTKPVGEGTGLGLSVSYGIIQEHGGTIRAERAGERGCRIVIGLPIVRDPSTQATLPTRVARATGGDGAPRPLRVLAVDDETMILELVSDALSRDGHRVETACSGREALARLEQERFDVLVLDLKMPEMDGRQLFEAIQARWPDISRRVIFASGDTIHPETREFIDRSARPCLDKPFRLEDLGRAIASVVSTDSPALKIALP